MKRQTSVLIAGCLTLWALSVSAEAQTAGPGAGLRFSVVMPNDASLKPLIDPFVKAAQEVYPVLLKQFENPDKPAPREIKIIFKAGIKPPAFASGQEITVNLDWIRKEPGDLGMMAHEMTHLVQGYPSPEPVWLMEGIADYARALYAKNDRKSWSLPRTVAPNQSYKEGYGVAAAFLLWLEGRKAGTVNELHRALQRGTYTPEQFRKITGADVDSLWSEYAKAHKTP